MRADMARVVTERPRVGGCFSYRDHRFPVSRYRNDPEALDDLPKHQSCRRPYRIGWDNCKEFSDLTGPLERFLHSRVGQKWDDVYSEIRERINPRSTVQIHILSHVFDFIETETYIGDDGDIWVLGRWHHHKVSNGDLYVHPETGVITEAPQRKRDKYHSAYLEAIKRLREVFGNHWIGVVARFQTGKVIAESYNHYWVGHESELHKIDGIWYWAIFANVPPPFSFTVTNTKGDKETRVVRAGAVDLWTGHTTIEGRYRAGKRQANRRDLRHHKLRND